jgi:hypothetical protein
MRVGWFATVIHVPAAAQEQALDKVGMTRRRKARRRPDDPCRDTRKFRPIDLADLQHGLPSPLQSPWSPDKILVNQGLTMEARRNPRSDYDVLFRSRPAQKPGESPANDEIQAQKPNNHPNDGCHRRRASTLTSLNFKWIRSGIAIRSGYHGATPAA